MSSHDNDVPDGWNIFNDKRVPTPLVRSEQTADGTICAYNYGNYGPISDVWAGLQHPLPFPAKCQEASGQTN